MKLKDKTMKLSENTITILKNFSGINQSILVKKGNVLRTISIAKNILSEAEIAENFPRDFAIYDLNQFLNGLSLHQDPDMDFSEDSYITIRDGKRRVKYFYSDPNVIVSPPEKQINLPSKDICFQLESGITERLVKAASVYQLPDISAIGEAGVIRLVVRDKKNNTSWESDMLELLAKQKKVGFYKHRDFWQCMDSPFEKDYLNKLWYSKKAPWKIWK